MHKKRCQWAEKEVFHPYHDTEWGKPVHDDRLLFELLILEGAQAGLSWATILKKRTNYKKAFDNFQVEKVAQYTKQKEALLLNNIGIIRNKLKISATVKNAQSFINIQKEFKTFAKYIWSWVDAKPIVHTIYNASELPVSTQLSDDISKDLKKRGFKFVGTIIVYAYLQAIGVVNDHEASCPFK
ncbi:DNA-3-methyladenine glycosylase [uncultured Candidatus Thioglobus sp.]|nr:DNA-3-methyladenine glycosylase [uncultured Candidatus Thioglobus sp.]